MVKYLFVVLYFLVMVIIGLRSSRMIRTSEDYYIAGKKGGLLLVTGSLLATILGSSAILGTADLALTQGWAASWLLLCAAIGLFVLIPVSIKINRQGKYTLPQMIGDFYGKEAKALSSFIIAFAWTGVIAAQVIGAARILNSFFGLGYEWGVWGSGVLFIFYAIVGGQISVLRTDLYQSFFIILGVLVTAIAIFFYAEKPAATIAPRRFPFNESFHGYDLLVLLLTYSTTFVVGPDIYSRIFCARNEKIARQSVLISAIVLIPFAFMVTYLGIFASSEIAGEEVPKGSVLISVLSHALPDWGVGLLVAALLSAVLSSASTTLLTSSIIISDPISGNLDTKNGLRNTKLTILAVGLISILLSLKVTSIIQSLLIALTIFSGSFIVPTVAGLLGFRSGKVQSMIAMLAGGTIALVGKIITLLADRTTGNLLIIAAFFVNAAILFYPKKRNSRFLSQL